MVWAKGIQPREGRWGQLYLEYPALWWGQLIECEASGVSEARGQAGHHGQHLSANRHLHNMATAVEDNPLLGATLSSIKIKLYLRGMA